jgi:hypothetical protein
VVAVADRDRERVGGVIASRLLAGRLSSVLTIHDTCSLGARPLPQTAALTCWGV